jgi:glycosyltransferase involved in cell wall biosynthesis
MVGVTRILQVCYDYDDNTTELSNQIICAFDQPQYQVVTAYLMGSPPDQSIPFEQYFFQFSKKQLKGSRSEVIREMLQFCQHREFQVVITHRFKATHIMAYVLRQIPFQRAIAVVHRIGSFDRWSRKLFMRVLLQKSWTFVAVSNAVKQDLLQVNVGLADSQVHIIHNAINISQIEKKQYQRNEARKALSIPDDALVFGCIGRLVRTKGHQYLLKAFAQFLTHYDNKKPLYLVLIGGGREEQNLKDLIKHLQIESHVILTGTLPYAFRYMKAFDSFILPSLTENFGTVLLEAMAAKCPIISTGEGGVPEVLGKEFNFIATTDVNALCRAMLDYYQSGTSITLIETLYQRLWDHFDILAYHQAYRQLLD